eukprot:gene22923-30104_t
MSSFEQLPYDKLARAVKHFFAENHFPLSATVESTWSRQLESNAADEACVTWNRTDLSAVLRPAPCAGCPLRNALAQH